ncbi:MAG TPA: hypothetical protein VJ917_09995, partial [Saprospiraceae bacterium]|nr:hypothetical protein [Saprospiraceae bacterium]
KHYNTTRLLQLPLAMGKIWQKNRFQTDLFLGTAVNLSTHSEGRTLYKDQVVNYEGASNAIISNQWSLHALLGSRLTYYINDHVGISTGFQCQKSLTNWSNEENVSMRPMIINWHVGTNYKF